MNKKYRVCHFPMVPGESFNVEVQSVEEAKKVMDILADYDLFLEEQRIRGDYSNVSVLEEYSEEEQEWISWMDDETGIDDVDEYLENRSDFK